MRNKNDFYPTPMSIVHELIYRLEQYHPSFFTAGPVWEPCCGDGRIATALRQAQHPEVVSTDIENGENFFDYTLNSRPSATIVTNPPFFCIREFIDHALGTLRIRNLAIVCPERLWACQKGYRQFRQYEPTVFANMTWREDYLGKGGSPDRALAVAIWADTRSFFKRSCQFEVWDKSNQLEFFEQAA